MTYSFRAAVAIRCRPAGAILLCTAVGYKYAIPPGFGAPEVVGNDKAFAPLPRRIREGGRCYSDIATTHTLQPRETPRSGPEWLNRGAILLCRNRSVPRPE